MATYIKFKCTYCGQSMECDPQHAGRQIKCPGCDHKIAIPKAADGKSPGLNFQTKDQTWMGEIPKPDVSTPTRYKKPSSGSESSPDKK